MHAVLRHVMLDWWHILWFVSFLSSLQHVTSLTIIMQSLRV